ncbi:hypothetical protein GCM10009564_31440 [Streptomyces thermogriseus]|uniref:Uncharacterized protein n=1 Tax=Streptomyces thermogriseus TaxID=75292 RepID=A0ABN1T0C7_9ACTN
MPAPPVAPVRTSVGEPTARHHPRARRRSVGRRTDRRSGEDTAQTETTDRTRGTVDAFHHVFLGSLAVGSDTFGGIPIRPSGCGLARPPS